MSETCKCCGRKYDATSWAGLHLVGVQEYEADQFGPAVKLELRDCECTATLSVDLLALAK